MKTKTIHIERTIETPPTIRTRQLGGLFDVPMAESQTLEWDFELPDIIEMPDWQVGLIVGPSGSGKSTLARELFGDVVGKPMDWNAHAVIDDFEPSLSVSAIGEICRAVGFNTIPAWMRPHRVLSTGEQFRVDLARRLAEAKKDDIIVVDEFTSVVDRQVAQVGSHAVQKFCRKRERRFVAVSCHYDILEWLQPDWVIDVPERSFTRRLVQRRPDLNVELRAVPHATWQIFAPFHYLTTTLHRGARCYALFVNGRIATFLGVMYRPHPKVKNIMGGSRVVTLPDFQGMGLGPFIAATVASAYTALGWRFRVPPAHPPLIRTLDRSPLWRLDVKPGGAPIAGKTSALRRQGSDRYDEKLRKSGKERTHGRSRPKQSAASDLRNRESRGVKKWVQGARPNAVFEYVGPKMTKEDARRLLRYWHEDV